MSFKTIASDVNRDEHLISPILCTFILKESIEFDGDLGILVYLTDLGKNVLN